MIVALIMCSLLLATGLSSLSLGNTSDLLDSALDFLSLLSAGLTLDDIAVLYNTTRSAAPFYIKKDLAAFIPNINNIVEPKNIDQDYYALKKLCC